VAAGADEVELLRLKPGGRGLADGYAEHALDEDRARALMPALVALQRAHPAVAFKVDCSFTPMLCAAEPDLDLLQRFAVYGCEAGHVLTAVKADLQATPCSFVPEPVGTVGDLVRVWDTDPSLQRWRRYHLDEAPQPCADCPYRSVCKGGCKAVTQRVEGTWFAPDPECPRVLAHRRGTPFVPVDLATADGP
jgi:radical SAM protein with 4Fe4S-binding SPASM domain